MRKIITLCLLATLLTFPMTSLAATEGLVMCHGARGAPDGKSRIVFGPADALAELQASGHQLGALTVQTQFLWAEVPTMLGSLRNRSFVFYDRNLTDRGGVLIGDGGAAAKLSASNTSGCEVIVPQKVCPNDSNPAYSVKCG